MKFKTKNIISLQDWNELVKETYKRQYSFQQQDGCKHRGLFNFSVPDEEVCDSENESISEIVNGPVMGISFKAWLERDPNQKLKDDDNDFSLRLWWNRNFYPDFQMVANDLNKKGLLPDGEYAIEIDW